MTLRVKNNRNIEVRVRLSEAEKLYLADAARARGLSLSAYLRTAALADARRKK